MVVRGSNYLLDCVQSLWTEKRSLFETEASRDPDITSFARLVESEEFRESTAVAIWYFGFSYVLVIYAFSIAYAFVSLPSRRFLSRAPFKYF